MSIKVNGYYSDYKNNYMESLSEDKDKAEKVGNGQGTENKNESLPVPKDEYISSRQSGSRPSGLYRMGRDENGNPKVLYDTPEKSSGADGKGHPKAGADSPDGKGHPKAGVDSPEGAEECTMNTDQVDREIKKLKEQKQQLEQQIKAAPGDEEKVKELEKKLARIEAELSQKDNDTYRRQNAVIS